MDEFVWVTPPVWGLVQNKILHPKPEQKSQAWKDDRMNCLTCSDFGAILGFFGKKRQDEVFENKTNQCLPFEGNYATHHGEKYEPHARNKYERETGHTVFEFGLMRHPSIPWLAGSPDGITEDGILLEIKVCT